MCHCFLISIVSDKKSTVFKLIFSYRQFVFFLRVLSILFSVTLVFGSFFMMHLGKNILGLSCLRFSEVLKCMSLCLSSNLGNFQLLFIQIFCHLYSVLSFWHSDDMNVKVFFIIVKGPWGYLHIFSVHFLCSDCALLHFLLL